ncbi:MAG TPA: hypothetical protein VFK02_34945 [Kofleriaceae bacterium]|nr:hypothetical protein [Kofleriaceae bacterium]
MSKVTFYGLPAWVGAIHGPTVCEWWSADPEQLGWDRSALHKVDLARTPSAAQAGHIDVSQIEVDDHTRSGGRTTIGPLWPGGTTIGALWVSDTYLARTGSPIPHGISQGANPHGCEHIAVHYFDGEQNNRRFHGVHAKVIQVHGPLSLVELWNPGSHNGSARPAGSWWLDLGQDSDPNAPPPSPGKPGPLYLDAQKLGHIPLRAPKIPQLQGSYAFEAAALPLRLDAATPGPGQPRWP